MEYFRLANGLEIPAVGSGTNSFAKVKSEVGSQYDGHTDEVLSAIKAGFTLFDTAESYGNEEAIGNGITESGAGRENIFIITKMRTRILGQDSASWKPEDAVAAIERSLSKLKTDYIDLYLIHMPWGNDEETVEIWKVLEDYYDRGVLKAIGVSNFTVPDLQNLLDNCRIRPMADEIKVAPGTPNEEIVDLCKKEGILPIAWGPLSFKEDKAPLQEIGDRYGKSWAQVVLRRNLQRGILSIPKSHSFEHQKENLDIFDFELTEDELRVF
ncbi:MAG: aldo/keto reductase [Oscillospiraceae bacterium]|nr:aldo/keto reductase [Oscillospiraceae bacterium]